MSDGPDYYRSEGSTGVRTLPEQNTPPRVDTPPEQHDNHSTSSGKSAKNGHDDTILSQNRASASKATRDDGNNTITDHNAKNTHAYGAQDEENSAMGARTDRCDGKHKDAPLREDEGTTENHGTNPVGLGANTTTTNRRGQHTRVGPTERNKAKSRLNNASTRSNTTNATSTSTETLIAEQNTLGGGSDADGDSHTAETTFAGGAEQDERAKDLLDDKGRSVKIIVKGENNDGNECDKDNAKNRMTTPYGLCPRNEIQAPNKWLDREREAARDEDSPELAETMLTQVSMAKGLELFGSEGAEAVKDEMDQLHRMDSLEPVKDL